MSLFQNTVDQISFVGVSLVNPSLLPEQLTAELKEQTTQEISGLTCVASSETLSPSSFWEKTLGTLLTLRLTEPSRTWQEKVTPAGHSYYRLSVSVPRTREKGVGFFPTPNARDWKDSFGQTTVRQDGKSRLDQLPRVLFHQARLAGRTSGAVNPLFVEWVMGFPLGWTDLGV